MGCDSQTRYIYEYDAQRYEPIHTYTQIHNSDELFIYPFNAIYALLRLVLGICIGSNRECCACFNGLCIQFGGTNKHTRKTSETYDKNKRTIKELTELNLLPAEGGFVNSFFWRLMCQNRVERGYRACRIISKFCS